MPQIPQGILVAAPAFQGACSTVTNTEATHDRAITLDQEESTVLLSVIAARQIKRKGGAANNGNPERHTFCVHPRNNLTDWHTADLVLVYPKADKNELRLYMSSECDFSAQPYDVFYILANVNGTLHVGFLDQNTFNQICNNPQLAWMSPIPGTITDTDDAVFQETVSGALPATPATAMVMRYPRNVVQARNALYSASYRCEIDPRHQTFTSAASGKPYVEAHHLIPMSAQSGFRHSLDVAANIVALCPTCHRLLHLGAQKEKRTYLETLFEKRDTALQQAGIPIQCDQLLAIYNMNSRERHGQETEQ